MTTIQGPAVLPAAILVPAPAASPAKSAATPAAPAAAPAPNPLSDVLAKLEEIRNTDYAKKAVTEIEQNAADLARGQLSRAKQQLSSLHDLLLKSGVLLDPQTAAQFARFAAGYAADIADAAKSFAGSGQDQQTSDSFGQDARNGLIQAATLNAEAGIIASFGDRGTRQDARASRGSVQQSILEFNSVAAQL